MLRGSSSQALFWQVLNAVTAVFLMTIAGRLKKMPFVGLEDGNKLWYEEKGSGMPIVFLHGWMGSSFCFSNQIDYFSKAYRVFVFEHKGHGKSDRPKDASYTLPEFAEELNQALEKLVGDEKIVLIGHSMGGMISLVYAITSGFKERLKGLILMSTTPKFENPGVQEYIDLIRKGEMSLEPNPEDVNSILVPLCFNPKYVQTHEETIKKFIEEKLENSEYVALKTLINFVDHYDVEDELTEIEVPTLILSGDEDTMVSPEDSRSMHEKIRNSQLKIFSPKIGHYIQFEALEEYNRSVEDFLRKIQ
jgi:pimeloyl-ACP methyl ester carboxylesterase